jgi:type III secretory pathway component EscV
VATGAATSRRLRLWHTAGVLAALPVATSNQPGFSFTNLLILAVVIAVFYPVQKKIREVASRRRRERWAQEEAQQQRATPRGEEERPDPPADPR